METIILQRRTPIATRVLWYIFTVIQLLLFFRLVLRLIGANPNAPFTELMYSFSNNLIAPFQNVVRPWQMGSGVFDWNIVIALIVYWLLAWIIAEFIAILHRPRV